MCLNFCKRSVTKEFILIPGLYHAGIPDEEVWRSEVTGLHGSLVSDHLCLHQDFSKHTINALRFMKEIVHHLTDDDYYYHPTTNKI